ncbi:hypothetical protein SAMN04488030_3132 [Aliiroseovarius halocynthiae]|uniref:Glycosyltransferase RgtA/B/C/D-like domain-containing protein n=1 Tax=Aliiroseovarius halocynthiae TaxID=985055 RepID=A0A545SM73_9RHOB|nr:hypothetical protein [Aliiroseovarius halocynthiae]TQV66071.1 hypothetical protein FIL88_14990 [Aliiroseovarius halocynthiae]SMR83218.1 hypothetical protein SAMN04488030_3132 [Aliiroseovarius halocynthiae]
MRDATMLPRMSGQLTVLSVLISVVAFALYQGVALFRVGVFEYPLDDVYIHLAVAEQIAAGGYGVNPGEFTSPASSPIYPFLLTAFAGTAAQTWLPLFWNTLSLLLGAALWARIVSNTDASRGWMLAFAALGPLAFNFAGAAMVGMEHSLHILASLAVLRGLQIQMDEGRISWLLVAGMVLGPMVRFEGLAVTGGGALALLVMGRWAVGVMLFSGAAALAAGFMIFLITLGLEPLPNSVMAKLAGAGNERFSFAALPLKALAQLSMSNKAVVLLVALFVAVTLLFSHGSARRGAVRALLLAAVFTGFGHLILGQFGWFERYELYAMAFTMGLLMLVALGERNLQTHRVLLVIGFGFLAVTYGNWMLRYGTNGPNAIYSSHGNMGRFVKDVYQKPVAVNDLGFVAWANPNYVLDLWGLASYEALLTRLDDPYPGWAADLVEAKGIELAIIYEHWIDEGLGENWVKVGTLSFTGGTAFLGGFHVGFFATTPEAADKIRAQLTLFAPQVQGNATLTVHDAELE